MSRIYVFFLVSIGLFSFAQRTTEILNQDNLKNWASTSDIDPRAMVALGDGRLVYFEDDSGFSSDKEDALILVDPSQGDQSGRFTVIASEGTLNALGGSGSCCVYVSDLALDASGNLYALVGDLNSGDDNFVVRIPYANNAFGTPELFSDFFDGGEIKNKTFHRLAVNGGQVYASFDDTEGGSSNGVYKQSDANSNGAEGDWNLLASHTSLAQAAFGEQSGLYRITAMVEDELGGMLMVFHEMILVEEDDEEVLEEERGAILRLSSNGTITVVLSSSDMTDRTGAENALDGFTCLASDRNTGDFFTFETGGSGNSEQIWHFGNDGSFKGQAGGYWQMRDAGTAESSTMFSGESNSFAFGGDHLFFWNNYNSNGKETLFKVDLLDTCPPSLAWPHGLPTNDDVSCHFGPRQLFSGGYRHDFHRGIDMAMSIGTTLKATADGVVDQAYYDANDDEWKLRIRHNTDGCAPTLYSWYNHLSGLLVSLDDSVTQGHDVALSGVGGTYEHLHFGVRQYNGGPDYAVNPLKYLPYGDTAPLTPVNLGTGDDGTHSLNFFEIEANDEELDIAGLIIEQGSMALDWDYAAVNRANAPNPSTDLDKPITHLDNGVVLGVFPEWMRADIDSSRIRIAVARLDSSGATPRVGLKDVKGNVSYLDLPAATSGLEPDVVFAREQATPNQLVSVNVDVTNNSGQAMTVDFEAFSAMKFEVDFPNGATVAFANGETKTITIEVDFGSDSNNNGDAILLTGEENGVNVLTALRELKQ